MYYLPKVHKNYLQPPGFPILSVIVSVTAHIRQYIDFYLQPLVKKIPSYLRDTNDIIRLLENIDYKGNYLLATADVATLSTSIPHHLGLAAIRYYLFRDDTLPLVQPCFIMGLLEFVSKHNYFWFENVFY